MDFSFDLFGNAILSGLLLGGFYAAVTIGVAISFGMLDIVNIAHPAFIVLGSYIAYTANSLLGMDPILASLIALPAFYLLGIAVYQIYHVSFERRGDEALRGLAFFFGLLFITEVALVLVFGVDYRLVDAPYIGRIFAICVMGGLGSFPGMVVAALALGIVESLTSTFCGPSWTPAVGFGFLLLTLAVRPAGIFGR